VQTTMLSDAPPHVPPGPEVAHGDRPNVSLGDVAASATGPQTTLGGVVTHGNTSCFQTRNEVVPDNGWLRKTYATLFHELQFRSSRNALMNYYQAGVLDEQEQQTKGVVRVVGAASTAGVLAGVVQKGKMLANRCGVAGLAGLPVCAAVEIFSNCSSEVLPSHAERAKKHVHAAAKWNKISERSRVARLRILNDPHYSMDTYVGLHEALLGEREEVARIVVIPRATHQKFEEDSENVFATIKRRQLAFNRFKKFEVDEDKNEEGEESYYL